MNANLFNRKTLLTGALFALAIGLNAQVKSTRTDEKFANTTIVYKKDSLVTDQQVLNSLGNDYGMGDVIRVTVAPPKPAPAPMIDKSKGEDVWLTTERKVEVRNLTASNSTAAPIIVENDVVAMNPVASPAPAPTSTASTNSANKAPVATPAPAAANPAPETAQAATAAPQSAKATHSVKAKSGKSVKKSSSKARKSGYHKMKSRKKGKQRYSCPKF